MKKLKVVLSLLLIAIVVLLGVATTRPDSFHVERSSDIKASPQKIFESISDFHKWRSWSPWEDIDPAMKRSYSGPASGTGTAYMWEGNLKVGTGRMEIVDSAAPSQVVIRFDYLKPISMSSTVAFVLADTAGVTHVTWSLDGSNSFLMKVVSIFMDMDKIMGKDFEAGLAKLKAISEQ